MPRLKNVGISAHREVALTSIVCETNRASQAERLNVFEDAPKFEFACSMPDNGQCHSHEGGSQYRRPEGGMIEKIARAHAGSILRQTRETNCVSQFDLALRLGVSQRHISFVESGRSRPSRDLVLNWTSELAVSESIRNAVLLAAGYSLNLPTTHFGRGCIENATSVHGRVLELHDPLPGMIFDADWRMLRLNAGAKWLFGMIMPEFLATTENSDSGWDMIAGIAHPGGLLSRMPEPVPVGRRHLAQLRIEQLNHPTLMERVDALEQVLLGRFGDQFTLGPKPDLEPGLLLRFETVVGALQFFTVQTVFKLPQDVAPTTVRTGLWYPVDSATRRALHEHGGVPV